MLDFVLDFLFPPICGICGKLDRNWICLNCRKRLEKFGKFELINNKKIIKKMFFYLDNNIYFDEFLYCFEYKNLIRNLMLKYKFSDCGYISNLFVNVILNNKKINEIIKSYDIIIPVPMSKTKKKMRGYNQTELIVKHFVKYIQVDNICLVKVKNTKTQSTLLANERVQNIKDAFKIQDNCNNTIKNKSIILFDDIATTGCTINEISKMLKEAGARKVLVLVIAKD